MPEKDEEEKKSWRLNLYLVPYLNVIYDCLFDGTPTMEQVNQLIGAWAFIDAILITMAGAMMTVLDAGQASTLRAQTLTFATTVDVKLMNGQVIEPYDLFVKYSCVAFGCITSGVFIVIIMYLGMGTISFNNKQGRFSQKAFAAWWAWNKWLYILLIAISATGVALLVISIDYCWSMQHGDTPEHLAELILWSDRGNYAFLVVLGVLCPMTALSGGLVARERMHAHVEKELQFDKESVEELILGISQSLGRTKASVMPLIKMLKEEHWLYTVADLACLDEQAWRRLQLPLKLEIRIKEVLDSEEPVFHYKRRNEYVPEKDHPAVLDVAAPRAAGGATAETADSIQEVGPPTRT